MSLASPPTRGRGTTPRALSGLWPFLRPYRGPMLVALLFLLLAACATLALPIALGQLVDKGLAPADRGAQALALRGHFLSLFAVAAALGMFSAARFYAVTWLGERITADLRSAVYGHVIRQSPQFFETTQTGEVLSRLNADTTVVQTVVGSSLSMGLRNAITGTGALIMLVWTNPRVMSMVLASIVLVVLPTLWIGRRVRMLSRASQDRMADSSAIAAEVLNATPLVQSYTAEDRETQRFTQSTENAFQTAVRRSRARALLVAFIIIANAALLLWGLHRGTEAVIAGTLSAGHLSQTVLYITILASAVAVLGEVYGDVLRAAGAMERLMELLATRSPVQSPTHPVPLPARTTGLMVEFSNVSFHYPSRPEQAAIQNLSLQLHPGETVALVGTSGAGKTTLFQLIQRFYDVDADTSGEPPCSIRIDGIDLRQLDLHALRAEVGTVAQDSVIFSTSALENIRYGRPNASDEEVIAAATAAHAHSFINMLPQGYNTFLGERGVRLSGGQRQRIAIARAILKSPRLLLLDEATSALDAESERMVQAALDTAMQRHSGERTTLVIAHRLATVQNADRIIVMEHDRIVEQGTHAELIHANGPYARLAALQFDLDTGAKRLSSLEPVQASQSATALS